MKNTLRHSTKEFLARIFGALPPSAAELSAHAESAASAEIACARMEAAACVQAPALQGRVERQAAMREVGLAGLDAATMQGNLSAARQALAILENESRL